MADNRMVHLGFWNDKYIQGLEKDFKLIYLYLLTNERTLICGLYEITEKTISNETELSIEVINSALNKFTMDKKVFYDKGLIFIPKYAFYQSASKLGRFKEHLEKVFHRFSSSNSIAFYFFCIKYQDTLKQLFSEVLLNSLKELMNNEQCTMSKEQGTMGKEYDEKFLNFWKIYDMDIQKDECYEQWKFINLLDKTLIEKRLPNYIKNTEKNFRKEPLNYLRNRVWLDEVIERNKSVSNGKRYIKNNGTEYEVKPDFSVFVDNQTIILNEEQRKKCYYK